MNKQVSLFAVWRETARSDEIQQLRKLREVLKKISLVFLAEINHRVWDMGKD